mgnify:FL=1
MKKIKNIFAPAALFAASLMALCSCSDEIPYDTGDGEGRLIIKTSISNDVKGSVSRGSRAGVTDDELAAKTLIWISNSKGVVRKYNGIGEVPAQGVWLLADNYVAEAWTGDSVPASFEDKHFKAREEFAIGSGETRQLNLECKIANVVVVVDYDESVRDLVSECVFEAGHKAGKLTYEGLEASGKPGYFMMPSFDKNISYTFTAKNNLNDGAVTKHGAIENAKPGHKYTVHISQGDPNVSEFGGALFDIEVDETEIEVAEVIEIQMEPVITGLTHDISQPIVSTGGAFDECRLWVQSTSHIEYVEVECPAFTAYLGEGQTKFGVLSMSDEVRQKLEGYGFSYSLITHKNDPDNPQFEEMKLRFNENFLSIFAEGEHTVTITVHDANNLTGVAHVTFTSAKMQLDPLPSASPAVWADRVTLTATILNPDVTNAAIEWRRLGSQQWNRATPTAAAPAARAEAGTTITATVTGLTAGTTYEYRAVCDGYESKPYTFSTEAAAQLPNAGFEEWNTSGKAYLVYASDGTMFWDSGNHGSSTMNKNVTVPATDKKHSGTYSAKLESQFVGIGTIGKFAAGNLFVGKYLATQGTDGVLGWGRPFTSRPKALRGYVHYTPAAITDVASNAPAEYVEGEMDRGIVYIAIVDNTKTAYNSESWPCVVETKTTKLFDKNGANVIAYGEKVFEGATAGSDMVPFEITLDYRTEDVKACNIILTISASKGGDYFTGGPSVMYVDDLELVY